MTISADDAADLGPDGRSPNDLCQEDVEDAILEGDRTFAAGTARAALRYPTFRIVFFGAFLSNIGSWMQNVVLGAFAYKITGSPVFVSLLTFAQLVPLLCLSIVGGTLADVFDRRKLLILVSIEQTAFALGVAWIATSANPSRLGLFLCTLAIGIGQAVYAPTFGSIVPQLVDKKDLAGAVSLNSVNMNLSRVIGPAIGVAIYAAFGVSWVFIGNAFSYLFIIGAMMLVRLPAVNRDPTAPTGFRRLLGGFVAAREDHVVGRCLLTMTIFSLFCLCFITQMPTLAQHNFGIDPKSSQYGFLYASFGLGAVIGALSIGTFLSGRSLERITRFGLGGFAATLTCFALVRTPIVRLPRGAARRFLLLRDRHVAGHRVAGPPRRAGPRPGHGAVGDGLRRHGIGGRAAQRLRRRRHLDHVRDAGRRRRRRRPHPLRQPARPPRSRPDRHRLSALIGHPITPGHRNGGHLLSDPATSERRARFPVRIAVGIAVRLAVRLPVRLPEGRRPGVRGRRHGCP